MATSEATHIKAIARAVMRPCSHDRARMFRRRAGALVGPRQFANKLFNGMTGGSACREAASLPAVHRALIDAEPLGKSGLAFP